jgi:pyrimidine deaminase RibD-like protein
MKYPRLNRAQVLVMQFQENAVPRWRFRLTLVDQQIVEGIPIATAGHPTTFRLQTAPDDVVEIPFADLLEAEPLRLDDRVFMEMAIHAAGKCSNELGRTSLTPKVGAVLVVQGLEISRAYRGEPIEGFPGGAGDHAEYTLLEKKLRNAVGVAGATLYTTLEPCTQRNSPKLPCVKRILASKISRVVVGMLDPNQAIRGEGIWQLREAGVNVSLCDSDQMAAIEDLNRDFIREHRSKKT